MRSTSSAISAAARPQSRRRSIGVVPAWDACPVKLEAEPLDAGTAGDGGAALALRVEDRALLDVKLEVGADRADPLVRPRSRPEVDAGRGEDVADALAAGIGEVGESGRVERPGERRAAEQAATETRPLLVGEVDQDEVAGRAPTLRIAGPGAEHPERGHDAERAVERPSGRHRVEMRAERQRRRVAVGARQARPEVAGLVDLDRVDAELGEALAEQVAGRPPIPRPSRSRRAPPGPPVSAARSARSASTRPASIAGTDASSASLKPRAPGAAPAPRQWAPPPPSVNMLRSGS